MSKPISPDWISQALAILGNVTGIIDKALPSEAERLALLKINEVAKLAKSNLRATKANNKAERLMRKRILHRIEGVRIGLEIAKEEGLDCTKLKDGLQRLVEMLGEMK